VGRVQSGRGEAGVREAGENTAVRERRRGRSENACRLSLRPSLRAISWHRCRIDSRWLSAVTSDGKMPDEEVMEATIGFDLRSIVADPR
jgi:hypothetical protein